MNAADIANARVMTTMMTIIAVNNNGQRMLLRGDTDFLRPFFQDDLCESVSDVLRHLKPHYQLH